MKKHRLQHRITTAVRSTQASISEKDRKEFLDSPGWKLARKHLLTMCDGAYNALRQSPGVEAVIVARERLDLCEQMLSAGFLDDYEDKKTETADLDRLLDLHEKLNEEKNDG